MIEEKNEVHNFKAVTRDLLIMRDKYGAESPEGRICSNIVQQLRNLKTYVRPEWATHEMQTLPYEIKQQIRALAKLTGGVH